MNLAELPRFARNLKRLREIITILSKYGLADWLSRMEIEAFKSLFKTATGPALTEVSHEIRIRLALAELGTTFIKFGQLLSTRPDLVGPRLAEELQKLLDAAPADPPRTVRQAIEQDLGQPLTELFAAFEETPLASASIGQVHRARLPTGEEVVVKVQHPGIEEKLRSDLDILLGLAELAEKWAPELRRYRPRETAAEFQRTLLRELDFGREERNLHEFRTNFAGDPTVRFPRPFPEHSTARILTMEYLDGIKISEPARLADSHFDLQELARRGATLYLEMVFRDSFYHADPHPGNILVLADGALGMLDCGMVGRIDDALRERIEELLLAITTRDAPRLTALIRQIGATPPQLDEAGLSSDVADFLAYYGSQPIEQLEIGKALTDLTGLINRYEIVLPASIALLLKVLIMLEGTAQRLSPKFNLTELLVGYQKQVLKRRLSPARYLAKARRLYQEWSYLGEVLPRGLVRMLEQLQRGRFDVHLLHRRLEPAVNRLVAGMLASACFIGSSLMLAMRVPPVLGEMSLPGALGTACSAVLVLRLYLAIRKSGHLDRDPDNP